jgi:putative transposase
VVADDHAGLKRAIEEVLSEAVYQRCYVHYADVRIMPSLGLGLGGRAGIAGAGAA